jgi:hypothetical protein
MKRITNEVKETSSTDSLMLYKQGYPYKTSAVIGYDIGHLTSHSSLNSELLILRPTMVWLAHKDSDVDEPAGRPICCEGFVADFKPTDHTIFKPNEQYSQESLKYFYSYTFEDVSVKNVLGFSGFWDLNIRFTEWKQLQTLATRLVLKQRVYFYESLNPRVLTLSVSSTVTG